MNPKKRRLFTYVRILIIGICLGCVAFYLIAAPDISVQAILEATPENPVLTAGILFFLYAMKSITIVFPASALEIAAGHLFPTWTALLVNFLGILIDLAIPYWIGYFSGADAINKLIAKYPKFKSILDRQKTNSLFLCFFFRMIGGLPADIVTMYFGATETGFQKNMIGGAIGILPRIILYTIFGASIREAGSPAFWLSFSLIVLLSAGSSVAYYLYRRKLRNRQIAASERERKENE